MISEDERLEDHIGASPDVPDGTGAWRQPHWAFIAIGGLRNLRGWIVPLAILLVTRGFQGTRQDVVWYGIAAMATVFSLGSSLFQWWNYRYRVTDRDITLRTGIISRQERVIPFERIQSVDLTEAPLERAFQVMKVAVETGAGGGEHSELEIQALRRDDATALRSQLLAGRQRLRGEDIPASSDPAGQVAKPVAIPVDEHGELIRKLSTTELLIAGATSGRIGAAVAIAGALVQFGDDIVPRGVLNRVPWQGLEHAARDLTVVTSVVVVFGVVAWVISIVTTVLTYGGFELRREGDQLHVQYGLLDRRRTTIPLQRIQAIRITDGILRQPFGYTEIRYHSAGFGSDEGASGVLSPLMPLRDVPDFLRAACPDFAMEIQPAGIEHLPLRAQRRYVTAASIGWVIAVAVAALVAWRFFDFPVWWVAGALLITPLFVGLGVLRYRDAGWHVDNGNFLLRWRAISRVTILTQVRRLQYRELTANVLQRRAGLATLRTAVASGSSREGFTLAHLDARAAQVLVWRLGGHSRVPVEQDRRPQPVPPVDARSETA